MPVDASVDDSTVLTLQIVNKKQTQVHDLCAYSYAGSPLIRSVALASCGPQTLSRLFRYYSI